MGLRVKHAPGRAREGAAQLFMIPSDPLQEKHHLRAAAHLRRLHQPDGERLSGAIFAAACWSVAIRAGAHGAVLCQLSQRSVHPCVFRADVGGRQTGRRALLPGPTSGTLLFDQLLRPDPRHVGYSGAQARIARARAAAGQSARSRFAGHPRPGVRSPRRAAGLWQGLFRSSLVGRAAGCAVGRGGLRVPTFRAVPMQPYDVRVDAVVTEADIYRRTLPRWRSYAA